MDSVDDEVLALIFRAVPARDRLRCEEVCVRWRRVLTNHSEFTTRLVLPPDPLDDSLVETTEGGWSPWREEARDDTLRVASAKAKGGLRHFDASGCADITKRAVIDVLKSNPRLTSLVMDEGEVETSLYGLKLRPRHLVALAETMAARGRDGGSTPRIDISVEVTGNRELEELRKALEEGSSFGDSLQIGGVEVCVVSLTTSLLFVVDSALTHGDSDIDEDVHRETNEKTTTDLVEVLRRIGGRGLRRLNFLERSLNDHCGVPKIFNAVGEDCRTLRELHLDSEAFTVEREHWEFLESTVDSFNGMIDAIGDTLCRLTLFRAYRDGGTSNVRAVWCKKLPEGLQKLHFEMPHHGLRHDTLDALSRCPSTRVLSFANRPRLQTRSINRQLSNSVMSKASASILADYLRTSSVTHLDLSNMLLDGDALGEILGAALPNQRDDVWDGIKVLILSGNERGGSGGKDLPAVLEANASTMLHLDVGGLPDDQVAQAIDKLPLLTRLHTLDISGTQVNMFGISGVTPKRKKLKTSDEAAKNDGEDFPPPPQLQTIGKKLAAALAAPSCRLKRLILESCSLTASDLREISPGVLKCPSLVFVDVSYNSAIGDEGCVEVARWIQGNARAKKNGGWLTRIHLEGCGIGDVGAKTLAEAVATSPKLRRLDLAQNLNIGRTGCAELAKAAKGRPGIWTKVTTDDNPWAGTGDTDDDSDGGETAEADEYFSEDDGYFSSHRARRPSPWSL